MAVYDAILNHPVLAHYASTPRWTLTEPSTKRPLDMVAYLAFGYDTGEIWGAKYTDERSLVDLPSIRAVIPNAVNCTYRLEASVDGFVIFDIERTCSPEVKAFLLRELPWMYAEYSMSGQGMHLMMPLPPSFQQYPVALGKPKVQREDNTYEILISHYTTFTGNLVPAAPPVSTPERIALWDTVWIELAKTAERGPMLPLTLSENASQLERISRMSDADLDALAWGGDIDPDTPQIPALEFVIDALITETEIPDISEYHGDHSRWHWGILALLHDRLTSYDGTQVDTRPVRDRARDQVVQWCRSNQAKLPPNPLYGPDQEAFILYRALIEVVPHRDKHDSLRNGIPLLLNTAAKLTSERSQKQPATVSIFDNIR